MIKIFLLLVIVLLATSCALRKDALTFENLKTGFCLSSEGKAKVEFKEESGQFSYVLVANSKDRQIRFEATPPFSSSHLYEVEFDERGELKGQFRKEDEWAFREIFSLLELKENFSKCAYDGEGLVCPSGYEINFSNQEILISRGESRVILSDFDQFFREIRIELTIDRQKQASARLSLASCLEIKSF